MSVPSGTWILFCCCALLCGCGSTSSVATAETAETSALGTVTLDGVPLTNAIVSFEDPSGAVLTSPTDGAGHFELHPPEGASRLPTGKYLVRIRSAESSKPDGASGSPNGTSETSVIPARYNDESELVRDIFSGENTIDLRLESGQSGDSP